MPTPSGATEIVSVQASGIELVDPLIGGVRWADSTISFSFPQYGAYFSTSITVGYGPSTGPAEPWVSFFAPLSGNDTDHFKAALQEWADVADITFFQVTETSSEVGTIRAAYSYLSEHDKSTAWAYYPALTPKAGDIWFNAVGSAAEKAWLYGRFEYLSVLHEIGHALGLKHPFEGTSTLPTANDSRAYTVMSYAAAPGDTTTHFSYEPTTPMVLDIAAIQYIYGPNVAHNVGNTTYDYPDSVGIFSLYYNETIWDAGGIDRINYSGNFNATIDLQPGHGSTIGRPVFVEDASGQNLYRVNNLWIAFGVTIENASAGSGNDLITGNDADNYLFGNSGRDTLVGGLGVDSLDGGTGSDTASFVPSSVRVIAATGNGSGQAVDWGLSDGSWVESTAAESLVNIENLEGGSGNDALWGSNEANILFGNGGGDYLYGFSGDDSLNGGSGIDYLQGGNGNDSLAGGAGNDVLIGGYGADQFVFDSALDPATNLDTIKDFASGYDKIVLENAIFTALTATGSLDSNFFRTGAGVNTAADGTDYLIYDTSTGALYYDVDGTGAALPMQFATLTGHPAIAVGDLLVV